jgi:hypothetical protein
MYANKFPDVFGLPDRGSTIWRYMGLDKFELLLKQRSLFFCRSDRFDDRFEGSYPTGAAVESALPHMITAFAGDPGLPERLQRANQVSGWRRQLRESVLVNCWHINEHESAAMWKLYSGSDKGISIRSTVQRFVGCIECSEEVHVGLVQYRDYDDSGFPSMNVFHPFMSKRKSFECERELRAVIWDQDRFAGLSGSYPISKHDSGALAAVDLDGLIQEIRVLPGAPPALLESVQSMCAKHGVAKDVRQSRLMGRSISSSGRRAISGSDRGGGVCGKKHQGGCRNS